MSVDAVQDRTIWLDDITAAIEFAGVEGFSVSLAVLVDTEFSLPPGAQPESRAI